LFAQNYRGHVFKLLTSTLRKLQKISDTLQESVSGALRVPNQTVMSAHLSIP